MQKYCGLYNLGNTCYMNSIIQILFHTTEFRNFVISSRTTPKQQLVTYFFDLLKEMERSNESLSPDQFLTEFQNYAKSQNLVNFTSFAQNDASEFLIVLMDIIHENISREVNINIKGQVKNQKDKIVKLSYDKMKEMYSKNYSELLPIFFGFMVSQIKNTEDLSIVVQTPQPFFILNLPIPNSKKEPTIEDCLDEYFHVEQIEYKVKNKEEKCEKSIMINNFPNILIIALNRFNYMNRKQHKIVYFPFENLDLNKYVNGYNNNKNYVYDLYGICNHSGSAQGGHYTSMVKCDDGKWYNFNDRLVTEIQTNVQNLYNKAYVLFFRKKST